MNFIELGLQIKSYREWMNHLLSIIEHSLNVEGNIDINYLDNNTYTFITKTVKTISSIIKEVENNLWNLTKKVPSLNFHPDPNFYDMFNWILSGTGSISIDPILDTDISELSLLTGIDFSQVQGISNKLVITGLPASTDPTLATIGYSYYPSYINGSFSIGGFYKADGGEWKYVTLDMVPSPISDGFIYELNIGNFTTFELIYPSVTLISPRYKTTEEVYYAH